MKSNNLLKITGLHVSVGDKEILHGVDLTVNSDETHVLMDPNGTGKSCGIQLWAFQFEAGGRGGGLHNGTPQRPFAVANGLQANWCGA